eukprot:2619531-Rhodomonas_salina.7
MYHKYCHSVWRVPSTTATTTTGSAGKYGGPNLPRGTFDGQYDLLLHCMNSPDWKDWIQRFSPS